PEVMAVYSSRLPMSWLSSPEEREGARDLNVRPNPAGEEFALSFESVAQTAEVSIYDISGALIDQRNYAASVGHNSLNMRYVLPAGVYIINLRQGERQISAFLVKK
ncbi:MAG: T9SS type A sorting domain-containing protein, partial [Chloroflexota bacterium]